MNENSVFIGGLERSGKTYMRFMLGSHPDFIFSKRTNLWPKFYQKYGELNAAANFQRCIHALRHNKHILALEPDFEQIGVEFREGKTTYERLFEVIHQQYARKNQKIYWGDQTEFLEKYAPKILSAYPNAKFIHLIRDPRDRYEAILNKVQRKSRMGIATARWHHSAALAIKYQAEYPDRYKVVRYETMVSHPKTSMIEICDFLGVSYYQSMLAMTNVARFNDRDSAGHKTRSCPLSTEFIDRYRGILTTSEISFMQIFLKQSMRSFDYVPFSRQFSWRKFNSLDFLSWPTNIIYMLVWHTLNKTWRG